MLATTRLVFAVCCVAASVGVAQEPADAGTPLARQPVRRPASTPPPGITRGGCPAAVPPATSNSVAAASDFIELERGGCTRDCPNYKLRIAGDGAVTWLGNENVVVTGNASARTDDVAARALMQRFAEHNYWALCAEYRRTPGSGPRYVTTLSLNGVRKSVVDLNDGAPSWLRDLDLEIDQTANSHQWRHGGPQEETFGTERGIVDAAEPKLGVTQLMRAAGLRDAGDAELVKVLRLLGDPNARDSSGWTALMYAAQAGTLNGMKLLLNAGADVAAVSNEGETALFAAVSSPFAADAKVQFLINAGVNVNPADHHGVTPLMLASATSRSSVIVGDLLKAGADPAKRDDRGRTAFEYVAIRQQQQPADADAALVARELQAARR